MDFARALILTNALGGLSSLGKAGRQRLAPHGGWRLELNGKAVDVVLEAGKVLVRLSDAWLRQKEVFSRSPRKTGSLDRLPAPDERGGSETLEALLPGRILLSSYQDARAVGLRAEDGRLVADLGVPEGPYLLALELTLNGRSYRTRPLLVERPAQPGA